jgi:hypothetical protein
MKRTVPTRKQRWRQLLVLLLLLVGGLLGWRVFALLVNNIQATSTQTTNAQPATSTHAATATSTPDWEPAVLDGFQLDIPGVLSGQHPVYINDGSGLTITWVYEEKPRASPLQHLEAETNLQVSYSIRITDTNICPVRGTSVTLASGFVGRQQTDVPPTANGPAQSYPYVWLSVVINGVAIRVELDGNDPADTFFARYGGIWQHILASLAPGPNNDAPPHNHPCG